MVRRVALAVSLALGTLNVPAHALGLGEIDPNSALNQNFDGNIELLSVAEGEVESIRVKLADEMAFQRAGVDRPFFLTRLRFQPQRLANGKPVIRVTSDFPVREPFLNFLVEVNWPRGRLLREYTVLLDPPTTLDRRPPAVSAPAARIATTPPATRPTATAPPGSETPATARSASAREYGPVKANETLWAIASGFKPDGVTMHQAMLAIVDANPEAFVNGDMNRLRKGQILRIPSAEDMSSISRAVAQQQYRAQQDAWLSRQARQTDQPAEPESVATAEGTTEADSAATLRIATARPDGAGEAGPGESDGEAVTTETLKDKLLLARENAETSRLESEVLRSKVGELEDRLADMQRLLSLKDEQLARLQDQVVTGSEEAGQEASSGEVMPVDETVDEAVIVETPAAEEPMAPMADETAMTDPVMVDEPAAQPDETVIELAADEELVVADPASSDMVDTAVDPIDAAMRDVESQLSETEPPVTGSMAEPAVESAGDAGSEVVSEEPAVTPAATGDGEDLPDLLVQYWPYIAAAAGGLLLLVLLVLSFARRKDGGAEAAADTAGQVAGAKEGGVGTPNAGDISVLNDDTSFLNEISESDIDALQDDTGEVDPVAEADVYIAYGRYQHARELLNEALQREPDRLALKHKLLEVYYATRDGDKFAGLAQQMVDAGQDVADERAWARAKDMGRELQPDNTLFVATGAAAASLAMGRALATDQDSQDESLSLDDLELSLLASGGDDMAQAPGEQSDVDLTSLNIEGLSDVDLDSEEALEELESLDLELPALDVEDASDEDDTVVPLPLDSIEDDDREISDLTPDEGQGLTAADLQAQLDELSDLSMLDADTVSTADRQPAGLESMLDEPLSLDTAFDEALGDNDAAEDGEIDSIMLDDEEEDAVGTKLDLARAYIEMGDQEGAKSILDEVKAEGDDSQRDEADRMLAGM